MARIRVPDGDGPEIARVWSLRPELGGPVAELSAAVYGESKLPGRVRESVRMRIAQINGCMICQQWRKTPGGAEAMTESDYAGVDTWRTHSGYTDRERLAIEYAR